MSANVNVHERTKEARHRLRPANGQQDSLHIESIETEHLPWWHWREYFKWEPLTVAGRTIEKGWVVPQPLGIAVLVVILGGVGALYWRIIDKQVEQDKAVAEQFREQRDILIRLDERLANKEKNDEREIERLEKRFQNSDAVDIVMNRDIQAIKAKVGIK